MFYVAGVTVVLYLLNAQFCTLYTLYRVVSLQVVARTALRNNGNIVQYVVQAIRKKVYKSMTCAQERRKN